MDRDLTEGNEGNEDTRLGSFQQEVTELIERGKQKNGREGKRTGVFIPRSGTNEGNEDMNCNREIRGKGVSIRDGRGCTQMGTEGKT
jgi:hypothetical protein